MAFFSRFSPIRAYRDLRFFLAQRRPHELGFLAAAMAITGFLVGAFFKDSSVEPEYHPTIIYVQQWRADRTDAEIIAQQKIDAPIKAKAIAERKAREDAVRAQFKRMDDTVTKLGL